MGNYCDEVDCDRINVHDGAGTDAENARRARWLKASGGASITIGNDIFLSDGSLDDFGTLAHELGHVYQFQVQHNGNLPTYLARGFQNQGPNWVHQKTNGMLGRDAYDVGTLMSNRPFQSYGMEQQAEIVRLCVTGVMPWACSLSPIRP